MSPKIKVRQWISVICAVTCRFNRLQKTPRLTNFGSEGWGFKSLRARHYCWLKGVFPSANRREGRGDGHNAVPARIDRHFGSREVSAFLSRHTRFQRDRKAPLRQ